MPVVAIRKTANAGKPGTSEPGLKGKSVAATQKSVDALPLGSGTWRIEGIPGLYVRCRQQTKTFVLFRRVRNKLLTKTLKATSVRDAKNEIDEGAWAGLKRKPAPGQKTFAEAFELYLEQKMLAEATIVNYKFNFKTLLAAWHDRTLREIGEDREGMRSLQQRIKKENGSAKMNQVVRLVSAVYNWQRKIDTTLPESPTSAVELDTIPARDWALTNGELRAWWHAIEKTKDGKIERGVKTLAPVKRVFWLTALFTGARPRSIENLKWSDVDLENKTIKFRVTKGDRPYGVPMSDVLHRILAAYRNCEGVPPSEWVYPSSKRPGSHLVDVKNSKEGVAAKYKLRHTFKTRLTGLGFTDEQGKMLMGHSLSGSVSTGYITAPLLIESLRPVTNQLATEYLKVIGAQAAELASFDANDGQ